MLLDDALNTACDILGEKALDGEMLQLYGVNAPVNPICLQNVSREEVIYISEDVMERLYKLHFYTNQANHEVAFFLIGDENDDGSILFDKLVLYKSTTKKAVNFRLLTEELDKFFVDVEANNLTNKVLCHGHTHGAGIYADNFTLEDMGAYVFMKDMHLLTRKNIIKTLGFVFNSSGDMNFVKYVRHKGEFYKYSKVYMKYSNGDIKEMSAYEKGYYNSNKHSF